MRRGQIRQETQPLPESPSYPGLLGRNPLRHATPLLVSIVLVHARIADQSVRPMGLLAAMNGLWGSLPSSPG